MIEKEIINGDDHLKNENLNENPISVEEDESIEPEWRRDIFNGENYGD
jgi:hypothetical protein